MQTVALSENAVAVFRLRVKGLRLPVTEQRLPAFQELVNAGVMEPDGEDFRFTEDGWSQREEILREEEERIERERYEPPDASRLSGAARDLLGRLATVEHIEITKQNRPAFRELAEARIVVLGHSFLNGEESAYRWTYWGWHQRFDLSGCAKDMV